MPAFALLGGAALYLLAHVAFRLRNVHTLNSRRLGLALVLLALVPLADELPALGDARRSSPPLLVALIAVRGDELRRGARARAASGRGLKNLLLREAYARPNRAVQSAAR